jgi:aminoglycoside/choline kinase family phosphotransferase
MLLEDLGEDTLYALHESPWAKLLPHLEAALDGLVRISELPVTEVEPLNPPLDGEALRSELNRSWALLLGREDITGPAPLRRRLRQALEMVCEHLYSAPLVPCHRDFMARNLIVLSGTPDIAILDHQDLRLGPRFYDLASLLNDSLFPPEDLEGRLRGTLASSAEEIKLYRRCAVQRTLKAAGTFEAFARRGSSRHVPLIAPTLARARKHLRKLPEGRHLPDDLFERSRGRQHFPPQRNPEEC